MTWLTIAKARRRYFILRLYRSAGKERRFFVPIAWENFRRFIRHVISLPLGPGTCTRDRIHGTDISSRECWRACWEERHGNTDDSRGEPRRLAVIRQANHPRPRYLNGRRYAVTSQLSYCLCAASLITPIGSYRLPWRRISDPVSMGPSQWARLRTIFRFLVRYIAKTRSPVCSHRESCRACDVSGVI